MHRRNISQSIVDAAADTPVIFLRGARQTGKSTLVQSLGSEFSAQYLSFDDITTLAAAQTDPAGFIKGITGPAIVDEVQRAPEIFLPLKASVDADRRPGRFILTGSADILTLPDVSDVLAGRMEVLTLRPLSQGELEGHQERFVDRLFDDIPLPRAVDTLARSDLQSRVLTGGYPEPLSRPPGRRRDAWFGSYLTTLLQRDVRDLSQLQGLSDLPRLLALLATRAGATLNFSELSRATGIPQTTLKRYLSLLEATFLVELLPPWHKNLGKRVTKSPKLLLTDTGLISHLLGVTEARLAREPQLWGQLLEVFVVLEIKKQLGWAERLLYTSHYRNTAGKEVDLLLEGRDGQIVGIEIKAASTVRPRDLGGLTHLRDTLLDRFQRGVVLYSGDDIVPLSERIWAVPMQALWQW